ncbi:MAG: PDZ domain-containing protein [Pseudomonadota bacterium]
MKTIITSSIALLSACLVTGCANPMHSAWAYKPLHDAKSGAFQPAPKKLDYREFDSISGLAEAESELHRDGYVMIGYVNMLSPQPTFVGRGGAKKWGSSVGASHALHTFGGGHYLATYWAKPKHLPLGAFYSDQVPEDARNAVETVFNHRDAVIIDVVAIDSPAYHAGMQPGDLIIQVNDEAVSSSQDLSALLREQSGQTSTFTVWAMLEGGPRNVVVELN